MTTTVSVYLSSLSEVANYDRCRTFVREVLLAGNALAAVIAEQQDRFLKYYTTISSSAASNDFSSGGWSRQQIVVRDGVNVEPVPGDDAFMANLLEAYLAESPTNVCLLENTFARRGDPFIVRMKTANAYMDESVLHVIEHGASNARVTDAVREAKGPVFVGIASETPQGGMTGLVENSEVSRKALSAVVRAAQILFVGAYDGEGHVIGVPRS